MLYLSSCGVETVRLYATYFKDGAKKGLVCDDEAKEYGRKLKEFYHLVQNIIFGK